MEVNYSTIFVAILGFLFAVLTFVYCRKQRDTALLKQTKLTEERSCLELEKREAYEKSNLLQKQVELQQQLLYRYDLLLRFHVGQNQQFMEIGNKIKSKQPEFRDTYDNMLKTGQKQFTCLVGELFTVEEIQQLYNVVVEKNVFNENDRVLLFMLSTLSTNEQIAALLNTTTQNLKTRKTYLKNKIIKKARTNPEFEHLLKHF